MDGLIRFFFDISDGNFRPFRSFLIIFPFQKKEIPDISKYSDYFLHWMDIPELLKFWMRFPFPMIIIHYERTNNYGRLWF
jgi:hypothetical protein